MSQEFNFFPEEFFLNQHFVYLKSFIKKHNNFFLNINEYWFRRPDLKKDNIRIDKLTPVEKRVSI